MPTDELKYWISVIGSFGIAPVVAAGVAYLLLRNY